MSKSNLDIMPRMRSTTNSMTILSEALSNLDNDALKNTPRKNDIRGVFFPVAQL